MARRYDSRTTTFSPEGRLFQVEYALESVNHAGTCVGLLTDGGVLLASEKRIMSKLLEKSSTPEKLWRIDKHIVAAVAGLNSDAMILINLARLIAGQYKSKYGESIPVENLVQELSDHKQGYTQFGGLRPYGVAFLFAGWDKFNKFQLYQSEPSGNYSSWKAAAIGSSHQAARSMLKAEYIEGLDIQSAKKIVCKVLAKTMDCISLTKDKVEIVFLRRDVETGEMVAENLQL